MQNQHFKDKTVSRSTTGADEIPTPLYKDKWWTVLSPRMPICPACDAQFDNLDAYMAHYLKEMVRWVLESMEKDERRLGLARLKATIWRRRAFVFQYGDLEERTEMALMETPELMDLENLRGLQARVDDVWGPLYQRRSKEQDLTIGRILDDTSIDDDDPVKAAKDMDDKMFSYTSSKGVTYFLNAKDVTLRAGKIIKIYYFTKEPRPEFAVSKLPEGWSVAENLRNGFPTVRKPDSV